MTDLVNDYFKRFYPAKIDGAKMEFDSMLGGMWRYNDYDVSKIFPPMVCADGFSMSVQGHCGSYSHLRDDFAKSYSAVEVGFPSAREELLMPYIDGGEDTDPTETVYRYVPIAVIEQIVAAHGGLKD
jgi:hypothetical protein